MKFNCVYWYKDIDLIKLKDYVKFEYFEKIIFHIMCFEVNKLCSLKPEKFELRKYSKYCTKEFEQLWKKFFNNIWSQWKYQNNFPHYQGPQFILEDTEKLQLDTIQLNQKEKFLYFCGGGKDSLATMMILDNIKADYDTILYTNSIYGKCQEQKKIIQQLSKHSSPDKHLCLYVYDDFVDCPILELENPLNIQELIAGETPSGIFGSIPLIIQNNYNYIVFGHEKSADFGNLIWEQNNEEINHQWGKSTEAEILLNDYLKKEFFTNFQFFSILKPLYDLGIFCIVGNNSNKIIYTHSCNIKNLSVKNVLNVLMFGQVQWLLMMQILLIICLKILISQILMKIKFGIDSFQDQKIILLLNVLEKQKKLDVYLKFLKLKEQKVK